MSGRAAFPMASRSVVRCVPPIAVTDPQEMNVARGSKGRLLSQPRSQLVHDISLLRIASPKTPAKMPTGTPTARLRAWLEETFDDEHAGSTAEAYSY